MTNRFLGLCAQFAGERWVAERGRVSVESLRGVRASGFEAHSEQSALKRRRILIIHQNFPGQFRHIARHLATRPDVEVVGLGRNTAPGLPDFPWFKYKLHREAKAETHPYLRQMEAAVLHGQAVARALAALKRKGFVPDVILAHPGWGETLYAKEIYPQARLIHFCEWYYATTDADFGFDPEFPPTLDDRLRINTWNALHLLNLQNCDAAIAPTQWQKSRFPEAYQDKIQVIHEGIDTENLGPDPSTSLTLPDGTTLKVGDPVVTYVARNLEPYRGFHQFMRALPAVLKAHPTAQILIVGGDGKSYGSLPKDAPHWRAKMLRELRETHGEQLDQWLPRIHFLGKVPYETYKTILQVSAVHVYLTYPFVLSWSLLEAMASGCRIIASDTAPVQEVIRDRQNGELVVFFDLSALSQKILRALNDPANGQFFRDAARADAKSYDLYSGLLAYENTLRLSRVQE
ncbi:glycosyltransferase family 4 protein [Uliginosibacterium paludis]|uniref:glycosyltransferase family 4 protein n=1 Tax=Uliginosibacterium paludis TaxID=1615952 RepID=UPI0031F6A9BE